MGRTCGMFSYSLAKKKHKNLNPQPEKKTITQTNYGRSNKRKIISVLTLRSEVAYMGTPALCLLFQNHQSLSRCGIYNTLLL